MATEYADTVRVEQLDRKHPIWREQNIAWDDYEVLHAGGMRIEKEASRFLAKRAKEPDDVYRARLKKFTYTNLVGTILGWYQSKLFRRNPEIDIARLDEMGKALEGELPVDQQKFFKRFMENADRKGTSFTDVWRDIFRDLMLYRRAYLLMDLPASEPGQFRNLAEQLRSGALDPYLSVWNPSQVINWSDDQHGNLEWAVLKTCTEKRTVFGPVICVERWTILDQATIAVYEREAEMGANEKPEVARLVVAPRPHLLSAEHRLPLYRLEIPEVLWIADRISLPARDHLNTENALTWALLTNNLAIPIISGRLDEKSLQMSEVGAWLFPEGTTMQFAEQSGSSFNISLSRLDGVREEIYRAAYLMDQGRSSQATPAAQSGISKQADKEPANDVLNAFGDVIRTAMQRVLSDVAVVRDYPSVGADVRGLSFDGDDPAIEMDLITAARALNIPSERLDKELLKRVARLLIPDANQTLLDEVVADIEKAEPRQDREMASKQREQDLLAEGMEKQFAAKAQYAA